MPRSRVLPIFALGLLVAQLIGLGSVPRATAAVEGPPEQLSLPGTDVVDGANGTVEPGGGSQPIDVSDPAPTEEPTVAPREATHPSIESPLQLELDFPAVADPSRNFTTADIADRIIVTTENSLQDVLSPSRPPAAKVVREFPSAYREPEEDPAQAPPQVFVSRKAVTEAGGATVLLAATIRDKRHGALAPIRGADGEITQWRVRATTAARLLGVCPDDPMIGTFQQPSVGFCTGVVVAADLVLTARHCLAEVKRIGDVRVVFDYKTEANGTAPKLLPAKSVVAVAVEERGDDDWALLRLAVPVGADKAPALCVGSKRRCTGEDGVYAAVHRLGMPLEYLPGRTRQIDDSRLRTDLDAYVGASGAPVFERSSGRLMGVVVSGRVDFHRARRGCLRSSQVHREPGSLDRTSVLPIHRIPDGVLARMTGRTVVSAGKTSEPGKPAPVKGKRSPKP